MLTHDRPIVVIAEEGGEEEAVMRLGRIGFDNVAGYLADGMRALETRPELVERTERITAPALAEWLAGRAARCRRQAGGARHPQRGRARRRPHRRAASTFRCRRLEERIGEVPPTGPVVVHCEGGYRSAIGASLLQKLGREGVHDLVGGFKAWVATKEPTATELTLVVARPVTQTRAPSRDASSGLPCHPPTLPAGSRPANTKARI